MTKQLAKQEDLQAGDAMTTDKEFVGPTLNMESWEIQVGDVWLKAADEEDARAAFDHLNAMMDEIVRLRIWHDKALDALARMPRARP